MIDPAVSIGTGCPPQVRLPPGEVPIAKILVPEWLDGRKMNETSQFGEDGLIEAAFQHIGETNRWCFEVGAGNGKKLSNTWLLRSKGWHAVLIEADRDDFAALREHASANVQVVHERIVPDSLDRILKDAGAPPNMDFGSIDIDGQDYWVWDGMTQYRPRVMCVEFSPYTRDGDDYIPPVDPDDTTQSGINSIINLGIAKGYRPVYMTDVNVLFIREDCCGET
jgi:hypothetical protein